MFLRFFVVKIPRFPRFRAFTKLSQNMTQKPSPAPRTPRKWLILRFFSLFRLPLSLFSKNVQSFFKKTIDTPLPF
jgi:hypothetical protein